MSLIKCPECNSEISDKANACPKCGKPISTDSQEKPQDSLKTILFAAYFGIGGAILSVIYAIIKANIDANDAELYWSDFGEQSWTWYFSENFWIPLICFTIVGVIIGAIVGIKRKK